MRVALFLNSTAGDGTDTHDLPSKLAHYGHEVACIVQSEAEASRLVDHPCELVVAAGGDGTVGAVVRAIANRRLPMAILPLGTANNIALTLGIDAPIDDLIQGWHQRRKRLLDYGVASGPWGEQLFVESVGIGLVAAGIVEAHSRRPEDHDRATTSLARTAQVYRDALSQLRPQHCTIDVDGTRLSGDFILFEALNTPFVGPNLVFAADASPSDGALTLACAHEDQRPMLDEYLRHRMEGTDCPISLPSRLGCRIQIDDPGELHVDDEIYCLEAGTRVAIQVSAAGLEVLV